MIVQVDGQFSIVSGELVIPAQATPQWGDQGYRTNANYARAAGLALITEITMTANSNGLFAAAFGSDTAFGAGASINPTNFDAGSLSLNSTSTNFWYGTNQINLAVTLAVDTAYQYAIVLRATGCYLFIKISGTWRLVYVDSSQTATNLYGKISNYDNASKVNKFWLRQLENALGTDSIATLNQTNPPNGTIYTSNIVADAFHEMVTTCPNPLSGEAALNFKVINDSNKWKLYLNATGQFRLDTVSAGVPTNRLSVNSVGAAGGVRTLQIRSSANLHDCYSVASGIPTKRGGTINNTHQQTTAGVSATFTDYTVSRLSQWPQNSSNFDELDRS